MRRAVFIRIIPVFTATVLAGCTGAAVSQAGSGIDTTGGFANYLSAHFAASEHDLPQAARFYSQSLKADPSSASLRSLSFFYSASAGDFAAAAQYANQVIVTAPDDRAARLVLAVTAFQHKDYPEARRQLSLSAKDAFTKMVGALFDSWAAAAAGDNAGVDKDIQAMSGQPGAESIAALHTALLYDFLGRTAQAEAAYKTAMTVKLETPRVLDAYGRFLERAGRGSEAMALYKAQIGKPGYELVATPGLARVAAGQKPDPLVRSAEDGAAEALFDIAGSIDDRQSADISILYLRMALYLRPDLAMGNILLADRFERLRQYDDAIAIYRRITPDSPFYHMAMIQAAVDEQRQDDHDAAIADLKKLTAADVSDADSWTALGDAYRSANRDAEALDAYDHAVKVLGTPGSADWPLFYARAMTKEKLHRLDDSEADIALALKLSPDQPELLNYLGYSWVDRGRNVPQALAMLEKARSLRPADGYIVDSVGWAYYKLGRYNDAADALEQAVLMVPGDPTINEHFGDALWRAGHKIEARFQWYHALTFADGNSSKDELQQKLKAGLTVDAHAG